MSTEPRIFLDVHRPEVVAAAIAAWVLTVPPADRARYTQLAALLAGQYQGALYTVQGAVSGVTWDAHAVRHRCQPHDPYDWLQALVYLVDAGLTCVYMLPRLPGVRPMPYQERRYLTTTGALRLLARFGVRDAAADAWSCDECRCAYCDRPVEYPFAICFDQQACRARWQG